MIEIPRPEDDGEGHLYNMGDRGGMGGMGGCSWEIAGIMNLFGWSVVSGQGSRKGEEVKWVFQSRDQMIFP